MTLDQWLCGLMGHDYFVLVKRPTRLSVFCERCGRESTGIEVGDEELVARGQTAVTRLTGSTASTD